MSTFLFIVTIFIFAIGYKRYGGFVEKTFGVMPLRKTPAYTLRDGIDYVPCRNNLILFGHHFASIAGAGPIIGPILAYVYWGWLPAVIWIIIGTLFIGAVHDFFSLGISVREKGGSIGQIAEKYISPRAGKVFLVFLWFSLILVVAVFAAIGAKNFVTMPEVVVSSWGMVPLSLLMGIVLYRTKISPIFITMVGIGMLIGLILLGRHFPVVIAEDSYKIWISALLGYAFIASVLPVNILLQPRDYLSSFLLYFGIGVLFVGLLLRPLAIGGSHVVSFYSPRGGMFFPLMFITVACGAISGFHSVVASGTTSKQIASERDIKRIGYGSMVIEGVLAVLVLFSVAFGIKHIPQASFAPAQLFSEGFATMGFLLGEYGRFFALVLLNAFILTTLDTATRLARLVMEELVPLKSKFFITTIIVGFSGYLALFEKWKELWPIFGASNQLVAALALLVISGWLFSKGKQTKIALIPASIMLFITLAALGVLIIKFFLNSKLLLSGVGIILALLGLFTIIEFKRKLQTGVENDE